MLPLLLACAAPVVPTPPPAVQPLAASPAPAPVPTPAPEVYPAPARLVAIGDLHGDVPAGILALRLAGLADEAGHWTGGAAWLVQTGDVLDRGPQARTMFDWLRQIEREAEAAGGRALLLNGNHEVMNLHGDLRYVADLADFPGTTQAEQTASRAEYFSSGEGAAWVRTHPMTVQVGDTVFAHGGIDSRWAKHGIGGLNTLFRAALDDAEALVLGPDGPLWNRTYLLGEPPVACAELTRALEALNAKRMVLGHTTQDSGKIAERCQGRLYGIDTGISAHYGTHPSALVIDRVGDLETVTMLHAPSP